MNKEDFNKLADEKKRRKLKFILKEKTHDCLTEEEMQTIINSLKLKCQYLIQMHFSAESFEKILVKPKMGDVKIILGAVILAENGLPGALQDKNRVAAIMIKKPYTDTDSVIHIYVPPSRKAKGKKSMQEPMVLCDQKCADELFICHHIEYRPDILFCELQPPKEVKNYAKK